MSKLSEEERKKRHRENSRRWRAENPDRSRAAIRRQYANYKERLAAGLVPPPTEEQRARARAYSKAYYEANKPQALAYAKQWHAANPEKVIGAQRKWRRDNPEKQRAATARWAKEHPVETVLKTERHRARKVNAPGVCTAEQLEARVAYYGHKCAYCGGPFEGIDHVVPLARGGSNWPANLRPACLYCNSSKGDRLLSEWAGPPPGGWPQRKVA
jgi:5-methylcytosine-specific restriction endonuclease McrA